MQPLRFRRHRRHRFMASLLRASLHLRRHRFDLQPLLHSSRSSRPLQSLNLQPTTLDLQSDAGLKPLQPLLAFLGATLNQQPLPPPTQLWLQSWRR